MDPWYTDDIMANLTVTVTADVLRRARLRALERGTSVNSLVADYLQRYAGPDPAGEALSAFLDLAAEAGSGSGVGGRTWTRDELYDRNMLR